MHVIGMPYDPWTHAASLGVDVIEHPLPRGRRGHYYHLERLIVLAPGMTARQARCTLTHEVMHAQRGDVWSPSATAMARMERVVNTLTALQLVTVADYARTESLHGPNEAAIAHELNVTTEVVRIWHSVVLHEMLRAA